MRHGVWCVYMYCVCGVCVVYLVCGVFSVWCVYM